MKGIQKNPAELAFGSVASILQNIYEKTDSGNKFLSSISSQLTLTTEKLDMNMCSITKFIENFSANKNPNNKVFDDILDVTKNIFELLKKGTKDSPHKEKDNSKSNSNDFSFHSIIEDVKTFAGSLIEIKTTLTKKFSKSMNQFHKDFENMLTIDEKKLKLFTESTEKFCDLITKLSEKLNKNNIFATIAQNITKFAVSIGIFVLSIFAISYVDWKAAGGLILFISMLGLVFVGLSQLGKGKSEGLPGQMIQFSLGIGILILSIFALQEVDWKAAGGLLLFISALGGAFLLFNVLSNKFGGSSNGKMGSMNSMLSFGLGLGILILAIFAIKEVDWKAAGGLILFILALGVALALPGLIPQKGSSDKKGLFGFALGVAILILTIHAAKEVDWVPAFYIVGFVLALSLVMKLFSKQGAMDMLILSASVAVLAGVLYVAMNLNYNFINFGYFLITVVSLVLIFSAMSFIAPVGIVGAGLVLVVALSAAIICIPLLLIQNMSYDKIPEFVAGISSLTIGFAKLTLDATLGVVAAALIIPIGFAAIITATSMMMISALNVKPGSITNFNQSLKLLIDGINEFGLIELTKGSAKALLLLPIMGTLLMTSIVLKAISLLDVSQSKINSFSITLGQFIDSSIIAISKAVPGLEKIQPGLKSLSQLVGIGGQLVDVIKAFANMQYNQYEVKNGKLVLVAVKKITDDDIKRVGPGLGKLIAALLGPMSILSSNDDTWDFGGGIKVKNPFKGGFFGDNNSGGERIKMIGDAYSSLMKVIANFKPDDGKSTNITEQVAKFTDVFADDIKWKKIRVNLLSYSNTYEKISKNVNSINIDKLIALERTLKLFKDTEITRNFESLIERLKELIGLLREEQNKSININSSPGILSNNSSGNSIVETSNNKQTTGKQSKDSVKSTQDIIWESIGNILQQISDNTAATSDTLSNGKIKVVMSDSLVNSYKR